MGLFSKTKRTLYRYTSSAMRKMTTVMLIAGMSVSAFVPAGISSGDVLYKSRLTKYDSSDIRVYMAGPSRVRETSNVSDNNIPDISVPSKAAESQIDCGVTLVNSDELIARFTCAMPENISENDLVDLTFDITISGLESGNEWKTSIDKGDGRITRTSEGGYMVELLLDSLDGTHFAEQYCTGTRPLVPGEDIMVSGRCLCITQDNGEFVSSSASAVTNSLFAYDPDADEVLTADNAVRPTVLDEEHRYIARIACVRHLRNLDEAFSGLSMINLFSGLQAAEIRAVQIEDIDFDDQSNFTPIVNAAVAEYDGHDHVIRGLTVKTEDTSAGLFGAFSGTIRNMTLSEAAVQSEEAAGCLIGAATGAVSLSGCFIIDSEIHGGIAAGGLIGTANETVSISECGVYAEGKISRDEKESELSSPWITAEETAGGLIGSAKEGMSVTIRNSFAGTVIGVTGDNSHVGGLVGRVGTLHITNSYADCYLQGAVVGGLSGSCDAESQFLNCYSAGFVVGANAATVAAGFVPYEASAKNGYSVFNFDDPTRPDGQGRPGYIAYDKYAIVNGGSVSDMYFCYGNADALLGVSSGITYLSSEELTGAVSTDLLSGFISGGESVPYGLTSFTPADAAYPYPMLSGLTHYNDWLVAGDTYRVLGNVPASAPAEKKASAAPVRPENGNHEVPAESSLYARIYEKTEINAEGELVRYCTLVFERGERTDTYGRVYTQNGVICEWDGYDPDGGFLTDTGDGPRWKDALWNSDIVRVVFDTEVCPESTAYWFAACEKLAQIDNIDLLNTSAVTSMQGMFSGCRSLAVLDVSTLDTGAVTDMSRMFADCSSLVTIYADKDFGVNVTESTDMFAGCDNIVGGNGTTYDAACLDQTYAHIDQEGDQGYFTMADMAIITAAGEEEEVPENLVAEEETLEEIMIDMEEQEEGLESADFAEDSSPEDPANDTEVHDEYVGAEELPYEEGPAERENTIIEEVMSSEPAEEQGLDDDDETLPEENNLASIDAMGESNDMSDDLYSSSGEAADASGEDVADVTAPEAVQEISGSDVVDDAPEMSSPSVEEVAIIETVPTPAVADSAAVIEG